MQRNETFCSLKNKSSFEFRTEKSKQDWITKFQRHTKYWPCVSKLKKWPSFFKRAFIFCLYHCLPDVITQYHNHMINKRFISPCSVLESPEGHGRSQGGDREPGGRQTVEGVLGKVSGNRLSRWREKINLNDGIPILRRVFSPFAEMRTNPDVGTGKLKSTSCPRPAFIWASTVIVSDNPLM